MRASVADFEVIEPLARPSGWLCRPPARLGDEEPVAVTELAVPASGRQAAAESALRFAAAASPESLRLIEIGPDEAGLGTYLATERWLDGSLAIRTLPMPQADALEVVARSARAAGAWHAAGLVHGSVGASAVMWTSRGPVLAPPPLDHPTGYSCRASAWLDLATVEPDVLTGEPPVIASDVWALGALLHLVVTGLPVHPGLQGDQAVTAVQRLMRTAPQTDSSLPPAMAQVVNACLAAAREDRPASGAEVADRLEALA